MVMEDKLVLLHIFGNILIAVTYFNFLMEFLNVYSVNKAGTGFKITLPKPFCEKWNIKNKEKLAAYIDKKGDLVFSIQRKEDLKPNMTQYEILSDIYLMLEGLFPKNTEKKQQENNHKTVNSIDNEKMVLLLIKKHTQIVLDDIVQISQLPKNKVISILRKLKRRKLILSRPNITDMRSKIYTINPETSLK